VVRSDNPAFLTSAGWVALQTYGIRTIVALRTLGHTDDEPDHGVVPSDVIIKRVYIEDLSDRDFVERCVDTGLWRTPIYYRDVLERWPERCAAVVSAVAQAPPGGVVISCGRGCDRTGLAALLILGLAGVASSDIAADWAMSVERLRPRDPSYEGFLNELLARENTSVIESIEQTLSSVDIGERLLRGGLAAKDITAIQDRLVEDTDP